MDKTKIFFLLLILSACTFSNKPSNQNLIDTSARENDLIEEDDDDEQEFLLAYQRLIDSYNNNLQIDTMFTLNYDTFDVKLIYRCSQENGFIIPKSYFEPFLYYSNLNPYIKEDLKTYNFVCDLMIKKNDTDFMNKTITKNDFINKMNDSSIINYGILFEPYIKKEDTNIYINFSISIPFTDIGIGVTDTVKLGDL